jgi:thiamine transporter ThiT
LASGVYGIVKIVATSIFIIFGIERAGRKKYFAFGGFAMGVFLFMIGAVFHTHPPKVVAGAPVPSSSIGMAVLIYLFVIPYCFSWGALCWVCHLGRSYKKWDGY